MGDGDGGFSISRGKDHQFGAWTYVYLNSSLTLTVTALSGDNVPRAFFDFDKRAAAGDSDDARNLGTTSFTVSAPGWHRVDITGYNQNSGYNAKYVLSGGRHHRLDDALG